MTQKQKAVVCILFSAFSFSLMNLCVRLSGDIPAIEKSFFRNLIAAIIAFFILIKSGERFSFKKENLPFLLLRSLLGTLGIFCNFYAVSNMVLSDASMLNKLSPFFTLLFSYLFLKEKLTAFQLTAIVAAFGGALLIIKPGFAFASVLPAVIAACGGLCAGAAYTCVRYLGLRGERGPFIVFFFSTFSCLAALPYLIFFFHPLTAQQFLILIGAGIAAAGGQFGITAAYKYAPAREVSIYDYSMILFAALWGFLFFSEMPDALSVLGYVIIFATSIGMYYYNKHRE